MRKQVFLFALCGLLAACSLSGVMDDDVLDYFQVNDLATNRITLLNVLRAKDRAPLHFSELSQIRGQLSVSLTAAATMPIGPLSHTTSRGSTTSSANVSAAPSFDIVSLDTKDFTTGVMTPITPQTLKFFFDEGMDYRLVLMLLSSGMRPAGEPEVILNAPDSARVVCYKENTLAFNARPSGYRIIDPVEACSGFKEPEFYGFLRLMNSLRRVYPITYPASDGIKSESVLLCEEPSSGGQANPVALIGASDLDRLTVPASVCSGGAETGQITLGTTPGTYVISIRSTLEVIQFVGRIVAFQEANSTASNERCVTLIPVPLSGSTCDGEVLFRLQHRHSSGDIGLDYNGTYWAVPAAEPCIPGACDHTLETMSMVALLLNQNKSAAEITKTPAAQLVP